MFLSLLPPLSEHSTIAEQDVTVICNRLIIKPWLTYFRSECYVVLPIFRLHVSKINNFTLYYEHIVIPIVSDLLKIAKINSLHKNPVSAKLQKFLNYLNPWLEGGLKHGPRKLPQKFSINGTLDKQHFCFLYDLPCLPAEICPGLNATTKMTKFTIFWYGLPKSAKVCKGTRKNPKCDLREVLTKTVNFTKITNFMKIANFRNFCNFRRFWKTIAKISKFLNFRSCVHFWT